MRVRLGKLGNRSRDSHLYSSLAGLLKRPLELTELVTEATRGGAYDDRLLGLFDEAAEMEVDAVPTTKRT